MSTATVDDFDTGEIEIPRQASEHTANLAPFIIQGPAFRRPDATGEIPAIAWHDTGIGIFHPISPAPPVETAVSRYVSPYTRPAPSRHGRGRHRHPSRLVRAWRSLVGAM